MPKGVSIVSSSSYSPNIPQVENVKLAPELLDPDPTVLNAGRGQGGRAKSRDPDGAWSGDATRSSGIDYKSTVTINYDDKKEEEQERKERLAWMEESTVEGSMAESVWKEDEDADQSTKVKVDASANDSLSREIQQTLLVHEKKGAPMIPISGLKAPNDDDDNSDTDSDEEMNPSSAMKKTKFSSSTMNSSMADGGAVDAQDDDDDDSFDDDEETFVTVGGEKILLQHVTDDVQARMTHSEREAWIQLSQKLFADHYD